MNAYSEVLRYLHSLGKPLVNTITQGEWSDVDRSKKDIFPLLHVSIGDASFPSESTIKFTVQVGCFDIRDLNKEPVTDKYYTNDNEIDNLNSTLAILNRIWLQLKSDFDVTLVEVSDIPTLQKLIETNDNLLDGWIMDFEMTVPNVKIDLCQ